MLNIDNSVVANSLLSHPVCSKLEIKLNIHVAHLSSLQDCRVVMRKIDSNPFVLANRMGYSFRFGVIAYIAYSWRTKRAVLVLK